MTTRKSTLKNIVSACAVRSEDHIDILNAKSIGKEHLTSSSLIHSSKISFLGFSKEVQKEPPKAGAQSEVFQGRRGFRELAHFDKHFVKNLRKKGFAGENFGVFSPRYS